MVLLLIWIILALVVGSLAGRYDRSTFAWFLLAILLSPLIAGFILLLVGKSGKNCPRCAERIKVDAKICRFCGYDPEFDILES